MLTKPQQSHVVEPVGSFETRPQSTTLLLLVSQTKTEERILEDYVARTFPSDEANGDISIVPVRIKNDVIGLDTHNLSRLLNGDTSIDVVPIGVTWKMREQDEPTWRARAKWMRLLDTDRLQRRCMKREPERAVVVVGESATRSDLRQRFESTHTPDVSGNVEALSGFATFVALQATLTVERDSRRVTGRALKYPKHVRQALWARADFQEALRAHAAATGAELSEVRETAQNCIKELVPKVRPSHVAFTAGFSRRICGLGYESKIEYDRERFTTLRDLAISKPTALVWTHKTHIDGLAMLVACHDHGFPLVHLVGGDNMAFLGIGYLMRRSGAIFIRRSIDDPVYKIVLKHYLGYLLEKGFPVSWALEGTRSRNGKLMPPRYGILKYVVEASRRVGLPDLQVVPISVYYDLIAELGDYAREQSGMPKQKESITWFAGYLRSLRKPLGRISLGIGEPVVVSGTDDPEADSSDASTADLQKIAFSAAVSANEQTPITPSALFSLILTAASPRALTRQQINQSMMSYIAWARARDVFLSPDFDELGDERALQVAGAMIDIGVVSRYGDAGESVYSIAPDKHFEASYYRNNAIHFFVVKAIAETALMLTAEHDGADAKTAFWEHVDQLRDIFKFEFFYADQTAFREEIRAELERCDSNWENKLNENEVDALLDKSHPLVAHAVLRPFAEAYKVISNVLNLEQFAREQDHKTLVDHALKLGRKELLQGSIQSQESIGKLIFSNALSLAENRGVLPDGSVEVRTAFTQQMKAVCAALEEISRLAEKVQFGED